MKKTQLKKLLSLSLCIVLIAAMALFASGCTDNQTTSDPLSSGVTETPKVEVTKIGEGDTKFQLTVTHKDGKEKAFLVSTNETTVGAALLELELISGEDGDYGLYIKTVDGETLDFDTDAMYWAFYINGEYAMTGVDSTDITEGDTYALKAEK